VLLCTASGRSEIGIGPARAYFLVSEGFEHRHLPRLGKASEIPALTRENVVIPTTGEVSGLEPPTSTLRTCLRRISADSGGPSRQISKLSTRWRTAVNGGVRGMAAG
jgi:hypothetical protein